MTLQELLPPDKFGCGKVNWWETTNLFTETLTALQNNGKTPVNVEWVGSDEGYPSGTWQEFAEIAIHTYYDDMHKSQVTIPLNLVIVGKDWWLRRNEYDGQEWWEFTKQPVRKDKPSSTQPLTTPLPNNDETEPVVHELKQQIEVFEV